MCLSSVQAASFSVASRPDKKWKWCNVKGNALVDAVKFSLSFHVLKSLLRREFICCVTWERENWERIFLFSFVYHMFIKLRYTFSNKLFPWGIMRLTKDINLHRHTQSWANNSLGFWCCYEKATKFMSIGNFKSFHFWYNQLQPTKIVYNIKSYGKINIQPIAFKIQSKSNLEFL